MIRLALSNHPEFGATAPWQCDQGNETRLAFSFRESPLVPFAGCHYCLVASFQYQIQLIMIISTSFCYLSSLMNHFQ
jgi:hypothetical protein